MTIPLQSEWRLPEDLELAALEVDRVRLQGLGRRTLADAAVELEARAAAEALEAVLFDDPLKLGAGAVRADALGRVEADLGAHDQDWLLDVGEADLDLRARLRQRLRQRDRVIDAGIERGGRVADAARRGDDGARTGRGSDEELPT